MAIDFGKVFGVALKYPLRKDAFFLLLAFQFIVTLPVWFITGYFIGNATMGMTASPDTLGKFIPSLAYVVPIVIIGWLVGVFLTSLYFHNAMRFYKGKRRPVIESFTLAKERFFPLLVTIVIVVLVLIACLGGGLALIILPFLLRQTSTLPFVIFGLVWFLIGSIIGVVFLFMTFLAPVFCVLGKSRPTESLKKSWNLVMKNKLNTFLFFIILSVIYVGISFASSIPQVVFTLFAGQYPALSVHGLFFFIFRMIFTVYLMLFMYSSYVNYYLDLK